MGTDSVLPRAAMPEISSRPIGRFGPKVAMERPGFALAGRAANTLRLKPKRNSFRSDGPKTWTSDKVTYWLRCGCSLGNPGTTVLKNGLVVLLSSKIYRPKNTSRI